MEAADTGAPGGAASPMQTDEPPASNAAASSPASSAASSAAKPAKKKSPPQLWKFTHASDETCPPVRAQVKGGSNRVALKARCAKIGWNADDSAAVVNAADYAECETLADGVLVATAVDPKLRQRCGPPAAPAGPGGAPAGRREGPAPAASSGRGGSSDPAGSSEDSEEENVNTHLNTFRRRTEELRLGARVNGETRGRRRAYIQHGPVHQLLA